MIHEGRTATQRDAPPNCAVCGATRHTPYLSVDGYTIVQCARCGFLFVNPKPSETNLRAVYQDQSYYKGGDLGYTDYFAQRPIHERLARARLRRIERLRGARGRLLDVGCAAGFFLDLAQRRGWEVDGVDLSQEMAIYAARLIGRAVPATVAELALPPASLDIITAWEYIEHVPDPRGAIAQFVALLRPGGVLALSTPNTGYWTAVQHPAQWREFKPPAHLSFFTEATLRHMLATCGLEVLAVRHTQPVAPAHPLALRRLLDVLKRAVGSGAERRTPLWWAFGLAWRAAEQASRTRYRRHPPGSDVNVCLEVYARKRVNYETHEAREAKNEP